MITITLELNVLPLIIAHCISSFFISKIFCVNMIRMPTLIILNSVNERYFFFCNTLFALKRIFYQFLIDLLCLTCWIRPRFFLLIFSDIQKKIWHSAIAIMITIKYIMIFFLGHQMMVITECNHDYHNKYNHCWSSSDGHHWWWSWLPSWLQSNILWHFFLGHQMIAISECNRDYHLNCSHYWSSNDCHQWA